MKKHSLMAILFCLISLTTFATNPVLNTANVSYFNASLDVQYNKELVFDFDICARDACVKRYYRAMEELPYKDVLEQLEEMKATYELSDWLYYKLIRQTVEEMYGSIETEKSEMLYTMGTWFFMTKAGYDTRLSNAGYEFLFLYVHSKEKMPTLPRAIVAWRPYYNLTSCYLDMDPDLKVFNANKFTPGKAKRKFTFKLEKLPKLPAAVVEKSFTFENRGESYTLDLMLDKNAADVMEQYPEMNQMDYLELPVSETLAASIIPQMKQILADKSNEEALEILVSFTRKSFTYKWDWSAYGGDRPMIADELLFSKYSDHEDRCALFYYLAKELLDLPMLVISHYNFDLTIAVELENPIGETYDFEGKTYTVCDPTIPSNSSKLGIVPNGLRGANKVVGGHKYQVEVADKKKRRSKKKLAGA